MADPGNPQTDGRKVLPWLLVVLVALLLAYLIYRSTATRTPPQAGEPGTTPVAAEATPTVRPVTPVATLPAAPVCMPSPSEMPLCQNWVVLVGPGGKLEEGKEVICIGSQNWVRWRASDGVSRIKIYFPVKGFPEGLSHSVSPFPGMQRVQDATSNKDEWVFINQDKSTTYTGTPNAVGSSGQRYCFKYDQEFEGTRIDGRMIIQR